MLSFKPTYYNFLNFSCLKTNPRSLRRVGERWPGHQAQNPLSSCHSDCSQPDRFHFTVQHETAVWAAPQRFRLGPLHPLVSFSRLQPSWGPWTCWPWCSVGCSQGLVPPLRERPLCSWAWRPLILIWLLPRRLQAARASPGPQAPPSTSPSRAAGIPSSQSRHAWVVPQFIFRVCALCFGSDFSQLFLDRKVNRVMF